MTLLKSYRTSKSLTQQQVAEHLKIPTTTYVMYENESRAIPADIVDKLMELFSIKDKNIFLPTKFTVSKQSQRR